MSFAICKPNSLVLQATDLHKDCRSAGEPYDVNQLVVKHYYSV